jgi:hypothetical protein
VANSWAPGDEISGSIKDEELLDSESEYEIFNKDIGDIRCRKHSKLSNLP